MASIRWIGNAQAIAQLNTITPATVAIGDVFNVIINGKTVSYTAAAATVADVCTGLQAALAESTIPEFTELIAADNTTNITLTGRVAGVPFTQTSSATGASPTLVTVVTTAASGPNFWNVAANWDTGSVPVSSDSVYLDNSSVSIFYGLANSAVTLTLLYIAENYSGQIGLSKTNAGNYPEYRPDYLSISATSIINKSSSNRIKINTGTVQTTIEIFNTGSGAESNLEAFIWKGTHASNVMEVSNGSVGIAAYGGESATVATLSISNGTVRTGLGSSLTTIRQIGGSYSGSSAITTYTLTGGTGRVSGSGTIGTLSLSGRLTYETSGTATTVSIKKNGVLDSSTDISARTITNCTVDAGGQINDPFQTITYTNKIALGSLAQSIRVD